MENKDKNERLEQERLEELIEEKVDEKTENIQKENKELRKEIEKLKTNSNKFNKDPRPKKEDISRREFLKKAGLGTAGLAALISPVSSLDIRDESFNVYTGTGTGDLTEYFNVEQDGPVNVMNADLDLNNDNNLVNVNEINGQDADNLGGVENHSELTGVTSDQHHSQNHDNTDHTTNYLPQDNYNPEADTHSRYTDSEASSAAPVQSVNGDTGNVTVSALTKTEYSGGTSTTHNISNNTTLLHIQAVGGGGGGAYTDTPAPTYGAGGAGVFFPIDPDEIPDKNIDVIVGEGGEGHDDTSGDAGTDTELDFGDRTITLEGGYGGGIGSSPNRARGGQVLLDGQEITATKNPDSGGDNIDYDDDHFNLYAGGTADDDRENAFSFYGGSIQYDSSVVNKNDGPGEGGRYTEDGQDGIVRIYEM